ncbi:16S rRNA (uracil(1498)-N(3))-methyltransferase [Arthrobacter roseus]|uniref:16S rRNA (uracil(1498)-N(3))-methyltransferase n=1 Tax=Arthrobacter roseus TaxID=136274 RepID=UPI001965FC3D|nr:16S rRNA (uracil(1498)-N(3))-methyltransferase [Arthrobacter roseus]MBM7848608.1 16S rRNA (uracil1498-N3)-methyltransferase [Arthrobacter roseus]
MSNQCFFGNPLEVADALPGGVLRLTGAEARHAVVKRIDIEEAIDVVDGQGHRASCIVTEIASEAIMLRVLSLDYETVPEPSVTLVQALAKGDRDEMAIAAATELGVDAVIPWQADRSIVRWKADKASRGVRKWESVVLTASKQSRRSRIPEIVPPMDTGRLAVWMQKTDLVVVLHETAESSLSHVLQSRKPRGSQIALVVGPEGGVSPQEIDRFKNAGAVTARLGRNVLRSSTAGPAALSLVMQGLGRWDED